MEKVKAFVTKHSKEIFIGAGLVVAYRIGFKHGCIASNVAVANICQEAGKVLEVGKF